jgi:hypothetical protein
MPSSDPCCTSGVSPPSKRPRQQKAGSAGTFDTETSPLRSSAFAGRGRVVSTGTLGPNSGHPLVRRGAPVTLQVVADAIARIAVIQATKSSSGTAKGEDGRHEL